MLRIPCPTCTQRAMRRVVVAIEDGRVRFSAGIIPRTSARHLVVEWFTAAKLSPVIGQTYLVWFAPSRPGVSASWQVREAPR